MNFQLIVLLLKIAISTNGSFSLEVVSLLASNLWINNQNQTRNVFLNEVKIAFDEKKDYIYGHKYYLSSGHYYNENRYIPLCSHITRYLFSKGTKDGEPCFLKFLFTYNNSQLQNHTQFKAYIGKKQVFENYKKIIKKSNDLIELESEGIEVRMASIKSIILKLMSLNLKNLDKLLFDFNEKYLQKKMKTSLFYFASSSICLKNLKEFAESIKFLKMFSNYENIKYCESKNCVESSYFKFYFEEKFEKPLQILRNHKLEDFRILPLTKLLIHKCIEHLIYVISVEQLFLPIEDKYDIDYYFDQIQFLIKNSIIQFIEGYNNKSEDQKKSLFSKIFNKFELKVKNMQNSVINKLSESKYKKHFSKVLDKEITTLEDYIDFEKLVCDYHYMMACILNKCNKENTTPEILYVKPMFNDSCQYRITKAIEINYENLNENYKINGCTSIGDKVNLNLNIDYFLYEKTKILISYETIRDKCINEIEIIGEFDKKISINRYLCEKSIKNKINKQEDEKKNTVVSVLNFIYLSLTSIYSCISNWLN